MPNNAAPETARLYFGHVACPRFQASSQSVQRRSGSVVESICICFFACTRGKEQEGGSGEGACLQGAKSRGGQLRSEFVGIRAGWRVILTTQALDNQKEKVSAFPGEGSVRLTIRTEPNKYTFFAAAADSNSLSQSPRKEEQLGSITSRSLVRTRKFDSMNTGTLMGVFAHGADSESCIAPAIFGESSLSATRAGGT